MSSNQIQVVFRPRFHLHRLRPQPAVGHEHRNVVAWINAMMVRWQELVGSLIDQPFEFNADPEDWTENVTEVFAAVDGGHPTYLIPPGSDPHQDEVIPVANTNTPFDPVSPMMVLGAIPRRDPFISPPISMFSSKPFVENPSWPDFLSMEAATSYARNDAFQQLAGRRAEAVAVPCSFTSPRDTDLTTRLVEWARHDDVKALVKIVTHDAKYAAPQPIDLPQGADPAQADTAMLDALGYAAAHLEGEEGALLLQDRVDMNHEYRVFVADGEPVAGAGCIERYTPAHARVDTLEDGFDLRTEHLRGDGAPQLNPGLVRRYREFAGDATKQLIRADPKLRNFVMDLCCYADGSIGIVELNPFPNSGFFATPVQNHLFPHVRQVAAKRAEIDSTRDPSP